MQAFHVKHWEQVHETNESRKYVRLSWCAMPLKHDGLGFRHMVRQADRNELIAGWYMILQVAGKGPRGMRGWLVRDGKALSAADLSLMTGVSEPTFRRALEFFVAAPADWLELADFPAVPSAPAGVPADSSAVPSAPAATHPVENSTGHDRTEHPNREREGGAKLADVTASRTQAGVLIAQIKGLEARGSELTGEERTDLRKKRAALSRLQARQARGDFSPEPKPNAQPQPTK